MPIAKKSSLQFSAGVPEEEDRKSLSLVSFCQVAKCLPTQPVVKLITLRHCDTFHLQYQSVLLRGFVLFDSVGGCSLIGEIIFPALLL